MASVPKIQTNSPLLPFSSPLSPLFPPFSPSDSSSFTEAIHPPIGQQHLTTFPFPKTASHLSSTVRHQPLSISSLLPPETLIHYHRRPNSNPGRYLAPPQQPPLHTPKPPPSPAHPPSPSRRLQYLNQAPPPRRPAPPEASTSGSSYIEAPIGLQAAKAPHRRPQPDVTSTGSPPPLQVSPTAITRDLRPLAPSSACASLEPALYTTLGSPSLLPRSSRPISKIPSILSDSSVLPLTKLHRPTADPAGHRLLPQPSNPSSTGRISSSNQFGPNFNSRNRPAALPSCYHSWQPLEPHSVNRR